MHFLSQFNPKIFVKLKLKDVTYLKWVIQFDAVVECSRMGEILMEYRESKESLKNKTQL